MFALKQAPEITDPELIAAVLDGSESAFAQLVDRYRDRVFRLLGRYCRDRIECEDLAQDVFLKVFRKLDTFRGNSAFYTWLYRIAVNTATDHLAKAGSRRLRLCEDRLLDAGDRDHDPESPAAPLLARELARVTRTLLEQLPEKYRTVLILREYEGLSYTAMSEVLRCRLGTVESRLFRARQRFKALLELHHPDLVPQGRG